jgi:hypothetical protein
MKREVNFAIFLFISNLDAINQPGPPIEKLLSTEFRQWGMGKFTDLKNFTPWIQSLNPRRVK